MLSGGSLEGQDLLRTYSAHHEPACIVIILITIIIVIVTVVIGGAMISELYKQRGNLVVCVRQQWLEACMATPILLAMHW